ncbi:uncharacterized protein K02A2.6-like [Arachis ipaensis]|uniref:uncharacterized protein K02A2.6-like n=1 Tax=Arachis ipaensis TaxID=130454 RepID=UPI0007AF53A5|nr:uncharacterized protein K02A2.6-like [Arachis ipaensis]
MPKARQYPPSRATPAQHHIGRTAIRHLGDQRRRTLPYGTRSTPIITRFGIPEIVISDNGTQFADKKFREFLEGLRVSHRFSSVEHPQTNGQVESANKIIVKGFKKRLDEAKGLWADELGSILWSYRTTPQTTTGETPFRLTYGVEAVIPVEIGDPSPRKTVGGNDEEAERDLIDEERSIAHIKELALKQRISLRYNHGVIRREFTTNDLVLRRNDIGPPTPRRRETHPQLGRTIQNQGGNQKRSIQT